MAMPLIGCVLLLPVIVVVVLRFYLRRTVDCPLADRLDGKTVLITGASSGVGREVALECAARGAKVVLGCRSAVKAEAVTALIKRRTGNDDVHYVIVDLGSLASVRDFVDACYRQHHAVDILVNNAAYMGPKKTSVDGYDLCFQVNFLSHFLLTNLVVRRQADAVQATRRLSTTVSPSPSSPDGSEPGAVDWSAASARSLRVVNVASDSYSRGRLQLDSTGTGTSAAAADIYQSYADSKLAVMLFTTELNFRHTVDNVLCLAVHPGPVKSGLLSNWPGFVGKLLRLMALLLFRDARQGAQSVVYAAVVSDKTTVDRLCGKLVTDCEPVDVHTSARAYRNAERLWAVASDLCGLRCTADQPLTSSPICN